jgi:L,D-transpeptidase-like protein
MECGGALRLYGFQIMRYRELVLAGGLAVAAMAVGPASANILITIDKTAQRMTVAVNGETRWNWRVSTGIPGRDTPSGKFQAFRMEADHFSKEFDDAPMPHSIFFTKLGHAIHGSFDTRHLGSPASHGCVRLDPQNASKLYALVEQDGVLNTTVVLTGSASAARRSGPIADRERENVPDVDAQPVQPVQPSYGSSYTGSYDDRFAPQTGFSAPTYRGPYR